MKRTAFAVVATCVITVATPGVASADSPEPAPLRVCDGGWKTDIYAQSKKHLGRGPIYKDGRGGTMVLTRVKSGSVATKITTGGGASVSGIMGSLRQVAEVLPAAQLQEDPDLLQDR